MKLSEDKKTVEDIRIAYGVAGPIPMRTKSAEALAKGQQVSEKLAEDFGKEVLADINPRDSWRASKDFRKHVAVEMATRCFKESVKLSGGEI